MQGVSQYGYTICKYPTNDLKNTESEIDSKSDFQVTPSVNMVVIVAYNPELKSQISFKLMSIN